MTTRLQALIDEKVEAVVYDKPVLRYAARQNFTGEAHVLSITFDEQDYAFAVPNDSALREPFTRNLLRIVASPEWKAVVRSYLGEADSL